MLYAISYASNYASIVDLSLSVGIETGLGHLGHVLFWSSSFIKYSVLDHVC